MKKKLLVAALFTAASAGAFAQANQFEGASVGVDVSSVGASTSVSGNGSANMGQQSVVPTIEAGYTIGVSKDIALGFTATYDLAETKGGSADNYNFKGKNHYSINFKPGFVVGSSTMVYALIGYNGMQGTANDRGRTSTQSFNGMGAGFGVQTMVDKNVYVKAEAQQVTYSSSTNSGLTYKPSETIGTIGLGYKF